MSLPRITPDAYVRVTYFALATLTIIVVTGAAVRLTGSGLGCPDWPTCDNGRLVAPLEFNPMVEFVNRVFTGVCSVAVIAGVLASLLRAPRRRDLTWLSVSLVGGVLAQAILGGVSVWMDLDPPFVMAHFLLSLIIIWAAYVLHHRAKQPDGQPHAVLGRDFVWLMRFLAVFAFVVMFAGTVVTGSGPHGGDASAERLDFSPHDVTRVHGALVWAFLATVVFTMWRLSKAQASRKVMVRAELLLVAVVVQGAVGYLQYAIGVPAGVVLLHIIGALFVWFTVLGLNFAMFERWGELGVDAFDGDADLSALSSAITGKSPA